MRHFSNALRFRRYGLTINLIEFPSRGFDSTPNCTKRHVQKRQKVWENQFRQFNKFEWKYCVNIPIERCSREDCKQLGAGLQQQGRPLAVVGSRSSAPRVVVICTDASGLSRTDEGLFGCTRRTELNEARNRFA